MMYRYDVPIVGTVWTTSANFNLYKIVVLPALSNPTINIRISFGGPASLDREQQPMMLEVFSIYSKLNQQDSGNHLPVSLHESLK